MYTIVEIEVTEELPALSLPSQASGAGFIVRQYDRPIAFFMETFPASANLSPNKLAELIKQKIKPELLKDRRHELLDPFEIRSLSPSITVAVCTRNRVIGLANCLAHLQMYQSSELGMLFELLVVDNAPSDHKTRELVTAMSNVRYVMEPKPGLNFARNRALREADSDILAFVDDDTVIDRRWFYGLRKALLNHPDAGAVTGLVLPEELQTEAQILFEAIGGFEKSFETIRYGQTLPGHSFYPCIGGKFGTGCNMAFRRKVLLELGGFDDALDNGADIPGGGDTDILYRVVRAGYPIIYEPEYMLFHRHRREYKELRNQLCHSWGKGLMAFVNKTYHQDPPKRRNLRCFVLWWFIYHTRLFFLSIFRQHIMPADLLIAQLWGGIVGLLFAYPRSVRRAQAIRKSYS